MVSLGHNELMRIWIPRSCSISWIFWTIVCNSLHTSSIFTSVSWKMRRTPFHCAKIITKDTPKVIHEDEIWTVFVSSWSDLCPELAVNVTLYKYPVTILLWGCSYMLYSSNDNYDILSSRVPNLSTISNSSDHWLAINLVYWQVWFAMK